MDMEGLVFDFVLIFIFIILPIIFGWALYYIPKIFGDKGIGKILSFSYFILLISFILYLKHEDLFFYENNVKEFLAEQDIILKEDFRILKNESHSSIGDYYHTFTLSISSGDQQRIIQQIKSSENYKTQKDSVNYFIYLNRLDKKIIQNYETNNSYVREYLQSNGKGYTPTFRRISIQKTKNELVFEDIDE